MSSISFRGASAPLVPRNKSSCQRVTVASAIVTGAAVVVTGAAGVVGGGLNALGSHLLEPGRGSYDTAESFKYGALGCVILAFPLTIYYGIYKCLPHIRAKLDSYNAQANPVDILGHSEESPVAVSEGNLVDNPPPNRCVKGLLTLTNLAFPFNGLIGYSIIGKSGSIMNAGTVAAASAVGYTIFAAGAFFVGACYGCYTAINRQNRDNASLFIPEHNNVPPWQHDNVVPDFRS